MRTIRLFIAILMVSQLNSQYVLAAGKETRPIGSTTRQNPSTATGATDGMRGSASSSPTIKDGASSAAKDQGGGSGANAAIGSGLSAAAAALMSNPKTMPAGMAMMFLGMMAMKQSGNQAGTQQSNADTANQMSYNPSDYGQSGSGAADLIDPKDPFGNPSSLTRTNEYKQAMANMKKAETLGLKYDPKSNTVTLPDGKKVPLSEAGLSNSGLGSSALSAARKEADKLSEKVLADMKKSLVSPMGEDGGGGGSSSSASTSSTEMESDAAFAGSANSNALADRGAASVAGLSKDFNGEPIGVAGDSIFDMIARRYQRKDKQDFFIQDVSTSNSAK